MFQVTTREEECGDEVVLFDVELSPSPLRVAFCPYPSHHAATTRWRYFGGAGLLLASFFFMLACYFMNAGSSRAGLLGNPQQFQVVDEVTLLFEGKLYKAVSPHGTSKDRSLSEHGSESNSNVSQECEEQRLQFGTSAYWFNVGICLFLVCLAGVMSGLTVGFSSIDPLRLDILKESKLPADQENRKRAEMVEPVMRNHHRLLVTLLLTNAAAMEALPIFLDSLFPSYIAIILSVTFVLFFGEVIPQALCTKNPLQIGAIWAPFISCLMTLEIPLLAIHLYHESSPFHCLIIVFSPPPIVDKVYPIAAMLDLILGHDGKRYLFRRSELATLISFHSKRRDKGGDLQEVDEVRIIQGALQLRNITVKEAMTPESEIFMLDYNTVLNSDIMADIMAHGHSRIPVYKDRRANIVVVLMAHGDDHDDDAEDVGGGDDDDDDDGSTLLLRVGVSASFRGTNDTTTTAAAAL
eukprot:jgi/Bigna1/70229/fgenesh1_pg.11_\